MEIHHARGVVVRARGAGARPVRGRTVLLVAQQPHFRRGASRRAGYNAPRLILADEPTGNLDDESTEVVLDLLGSLADGHGCTLVVATHDEKVASRWDRRLNLENGVLRV